MRSVTPAMSQPRYDHADRPGFLAASADMVYRHSVWILIALATAFIGVRISRPEARAAATLQRETEVRAAMAALHDSQLAHFAAGDPHRCSSLAEVVAASPPESPLRHFKLGEYAGADVLEGHGYYLTMYLVDAGRDDDRAWSRRQASADAGQRGYGLFAWPMHYSSETQWAFFVDHRGWLLGTWNFEGRFGGLADPFPPPEHPLREYQDSLKSGAEPEWFLFRSDLGEIQVPLISKGRDDGQE